MNRLKATREELGWSQLRAVTAIRDQARAMGVEVPATSSLKTQLSRWENGHHDPDAFNRNLLVRAFGRTAIELGLERLAPGVDPLAVGRTWQEGSQMSTALWEDDMNRRALLSLSFAGAAFAGPALAAVLNTNATAPAQPDGGRPIGTEQVEAIRRMHARFGRLDNRFGAGEVRDAAVAYLANDVAPILRDGRFNRATGAALFTTAAELNQLVGWMSHDISAHGLGQRYLIQALNLSRSADNTALSAEILAAMSHQATYLGDGSTAVDLAQAAGQLAVRSGIAALTAEAHVMEAHGHATLGQSAECARSLDAAEKTLDRADRAADPIWIGYFDEAYLSAKFGHCFRALGDHANAIHFASNSLNMKSPSDYARGRAFNLSLLADSYARAGRVEEACDVGQQAVTATEQLHSKRAIRYLRQLRATLRPAAATETVRDLDRRLQPLLAPAI